VGGGGARLGDGADNVRLDGVLDGELAAALHAHRIHHLALEDAVGAREVHVLEDAEGLDFVFGALDDVDGADAVAGHLDYLAGEDLADVLGPDGEEAARLGGDDPTFSLSAVVAVAVEGYKQSKLIFLWISARTDT
jgi:hypothetical protein